MHAHTCGYVHVPACTHTKVRGLLCGVSALLPPLHRLWALNSGLQACVSSAFLADPFCQPKGLKESQRAGDSNPLPEYFQDLRAPDLLALIRDSSLSALSKGLCILRIYKEPS